MATGRRIKSSENRLFTAFPSPERTRGGAHAKALAESLEEEIDDRRRIEGQHLAEGETADNRQPQWTAKLRADAGSQHQRQRAEDRRDRRHQDRPEAQETGLIDRFARRQSLLALRVEREVDHHDRVLLDDADQEHDANDADDVEPGAGRIERQQRADAGGGKRGQDRDRVDEALVEHPKHDIHGRNRRREQEHLVRQRRLEGLRCALEADGETRRKVNLLQRLSDRIDRLAERPARREVERDRRHRKLF